MIFLHVGASQTGDHRRRVNGRRGGVDASEVAKRTSSWYIVHWLNGQLLLIRFYECCERRETTGHPYYDLCIVDPDRHALGDARKWNSALRMIHIVLLSGGSGTRLWPLSNNARSKQFLKVLRDDSGNHVSMVQRVFEQIGRVNADFDVTIATAQTQVSSLEMQVDGDYQLVVEPERRDTAPAIMLACEHLALKQQADAQDTVVVMPIDTYASQDYYVSIVALNAAVQGDAAELVLLGVKPTYPSEKFGYIIPRNVELDKAKERKTGDELVVLPVVAFKEKPSACEAESLIEQGALWNCGVFAFKLGYVRSVTSNFLKAASFEELLSRYVELPKNSFDYEVVEKAQSIAVVPYAGTWKDLGTWNTLTEEMADAHAGRAVVDTQSSKNTHVINETALPLVVAGVEDAAVVATHDGILVCSKEMSGSSELKTLISDAAASRPMYERRKWGEYRVLDANVYSDGTKSLTKELIVNAGEQISYQKHFDRSEIWTIAYGCGEVVIDDEVRSIKAGDTIEITPGGMHAVRAVEELHIIEVQLGSVLNEEDIQRQGFFW